MDEGGILKSQIVACMKDAKVQLEKCKDAHLDCISNVHTSRLADDNAWIEEIYSLYESCNQKVYTYLLSMSEIELKQKRSLNMKMERIKMPQFDGDIRNYAKFKADFKRQVEE